MVSRFTEMLDGGALNLSCRHDWFEVVAPTRVRRNPWSIKANRRGCGQRVNGCGLSTVCGSLQIAIDCLSCCRFHSQIAMVWESLSWNTQNPPSLDCSKGHCFKDEEWFRMMSEIRRFHGLISE